MYHPFCEIWGFGGGENIQKEEEEEGRGEILRSENAPFFFFEYFRGTQISHLVFLKGDIHTSPLPRKKGDFFLLALVYLLALPRARERNRRGRKERGAFLSFLPFFDVHHPHFATHFRTILV